METDPRHAETRKVETPDVDRSRVDYTPTAQTPAIDDDQHHSGLEHPGIKTVARDMRRTNEALRQAQADRDRYRSERDKALDENAELRAILKSAGLGRGTDPAPTQTSGALEPVKEPRGRRLPALLVPALVLLAWIALYAWLTKGAR